MEGIGRDRGSFDPFGGSLAQQQSVNRLAAPFCFFLWVLPDRSGRRTDLGEEPIRTLSPLRTPAFGAHWCFRAAKPGSSAAQDFGTSSELRDLTHRCGARTN